MAITDVEKVVLPAVGSSHYRRPAEAFPEYVQGGRQERASEPHRR